MTGPLENLLVGRTLAGRYAVEEPIGRGGMSVVYRARDERLGRSVAVKVVSFPGRLDAGQRRELRERLRREAASAARIPSHPHVVQVYDHGTDPELDLDFIAMEFLRGRDLRDLLRGGGVGIEQGLRILHQAAEGLAAGHREGIVHRDVKPGNIFVVDAAGETQIKILDFGIAKALAATAEDEDELTRPERVPHSPAYASPEQLNPALRITPASDVYQLGLVAYELLSGERPYSAGERERIRAGEEVALPARGRWAEVEESVRSAVRRALSLDPQARYPSAEAFAHALPPPDAETHTRAGPGAARSAPRSTDGVPGDATLPLAGEPGAPARSFRRPALIVAGLGLAALALWGITRPGESAPPADPGRMDGMELEARQQRFRPLVFEAYANLREAASALEGAEAAAAVQEVIVELHASWAEGDLDRHLTVYAERVDFHGSRGTSRDRIAEIRRETLERYPERTIVLTRQAIEFTEPGRARALVDKQWRFQGAEESWEGAARHELVVVRETADERWRVVAERELARFSEEADFAGT